MTKILISAGEASGDLHSAHLIKTVLAQNPAITFMGMGGKHMREAGCKMIVDNAGMAVIGLFEILLHVKAIHRAMKAMRRAIREEKPDLLILVDYSAFNLRLARYAKKNFGTKTLYYISPQVWAWRSGRVKTIRKYIDHMAVIFPFELDFYQRANVAATYVGNSLVDKAKPTISREQAYQQFELNQNNDIIALAAGSRKGEIKRLLPDMIKAAELLAQKQPQLQFVLPLAASLTQADIEPYLKNTTLPIKVIPQQLYNLLQLCTAVIAVSGTVTLEIALMGIPMVIIYRGAALSFQIVKRMVNISNIGMCNLIAGKTVVPELIQNDAIPEKIAEQILTILIDTDYRNTMQTDLIKMKEKMQKLPGTKPIADLILSMA